MEAASSTTNSGINADKEKMMAKLPEADSPEGSSSGDDNNIMAAAADKPTMQPCTSEGKDPPSGDDEGIATAVHVAKRKSAPEEETRLLQGDNEADDKPPTKKAKLGETATGTGDDKANGAVEIGTSFPPPVGEGLEVNKRDPSPHSTSIKNRLMNLLGGNVASENPPVGANDDNDKEGEPTVDASRGVSIIFPFAAGRPKAEDDTAEEELIVDADEEEATTDVAADVAKEEAPASTTSDDSSNDGSKDEGPLTVDKGSDEPGSDDSDNMDVVDAETDSNSKSDSNGQEEEASVVVAKESPSPSDDIFNGDALEESSDDKNKAGAASPTSTGDQDEKESVASSSKSDGDEYLESVVAANQVALSLVDNSKAASLIEPSTEEETTTTDTTGSSKAEVAATVEVAVAATTTDNDAEKEPAGANDKDKEPASAKAPPRDSSGDAGPEEVAQVELILAKRRKAEEADEIFMDGWYNWVSDLLDYYKTHGHCQVRDAESHALYNWLKRQRVMYRKGKLEKDKLNILQLLKTNGFEVIREETAKATSTKVKAAISARSGSKKQKSSRASKEKSAKQSAAQSQVSAATYQTDAIDLGAGERAMGQEVPSSIPTERRSLLSSNMEQLLGLRDQDIAGQMVLRAQQQQLLQLRQQQQEQQQSRAAPQDAPGSVLAIERRGEEANPALSILLGTNQPSSLYDFHSGAQDPNLTERNRNQQALVLLLQQQQADQQAQQQQQRQHDVLLLQQLLQQYQRPPSGPPPRGDP